MQAQRFSLLIKPTSADCNLRCAYCFYLSRSRLYPSTRAHRMADKVLKRVISTYLSTDQEQYVFGWQGGEPTLMGVDFYRRVTELQQKYGRAGALVCNGLQTNATLIDDDLAQHLSDYRFLVGASLDGPKQLHDHYRKKIGGQDCHADVVRGIRRLEAHRVAFNILVLVNDINVKRAVELYEYLCENGWVYHQYIPCVEFDEHGKPAPFAVTGPQWGDFLCALFDRWIRSDFGKVSVRLFDSILTKLVDGRVTICHMGRDCRQYYVVEHNGDLYPCDFFVDREHYLGNLEGGSWDGLHQSKIYRDFGEQKSRYHAACSACDFLSLCAGDCPKHRLYHGNPRDLSFLCEGWKAFYRHALPEFRRLARALKRETRAASTPAAPLDGRRAALSVGRNDPCPCGSGKKYKNCCFRRA
ncbi:MAG: anaerobic sulfatase maturase [Deltaproteobacteria bacterium]|nr:anaerobic sulfatase maturase [Deltaproteobacteria bacterium]